MAMNNFIVVKVCETHGHLDNLLSIKTYDTINRRPTYQRQQGDLWKPIPVRQNIAIAVPGHTHAARCTLTTSGGHVVDNPEISDVSMGICSRYCGSLV